MEPLKNLGRVKVKLYVRILCHISGNFVVFILRCKADSEILEAVVYGACIYGGRANSWRLKFGWEMCGSMTGWNTVSVVEL